MDNNNMNFNDNEQNRSNNTNANKPSESTSDYNYQYNTKEEVLDYILDGIRFPSLDETGGNKSLLEFESHYKDGECSASGTPLEVLASVRDQLSNKYAEQAKAEARKELKLKYIKIS